MKNSKKVGSAMPNTASVALACKRMGRLNDSKHFAKEKSAVTMTDGFSPSPNTIMSSRSALFALCFFYLLFCFVAGYYGSHDSDVPRPMEYFFTLVLAVNVYVWYRADARERAFKTTTLMGGCIILFAMVAVPVYLYRTRPAGQRTKAYLKLLGGFLLGLVLTVLVGVLLAP